jgi:hypothetical protein
LLTSIYSKPAPYFPVENKNKPADIVFFVDASKSVSKSDFKKMLAFVKYCISPLNIGQFGVHVGLTVYSDTWVHEISLGQYTSKPQLLAAVDKAKYIGEGRNIGKAFEHIMKDTFHTWQDRPGAVNILIVLTAGVSSNPKHLQSYAEILQFRMFETFAIGIGNAVDDKQLKLIAAEGTGKVLKTASFDTLHTIRNELLWYTYMIPNFPVENKNKPADIVFLLDASKSVSKSDYKKMKDFVKYFITPLNIGSKNVQIGITIFSDKSENGFWLNQNTDKTKLLKAVGGVKYMGGGTNTGKGIEYILKNSFTA